jgi:hypothetical protein
MLFMFGVWIRTIQHAHTFDFCWFQFIEFDCRPSNCLPKYLTSLYKICYFTIFKLFHTYFTWISLVTSPVAAPPNFAPFGFRKTQAPLAQRPSIPAQSAHSAHFPWHRRHFRQNIWELQRIKGINHQPW